jgi:glucosylceramidase
VPVNAVSVQNEVDAEQEGHMPACLWSQEQEWQFVGDHLGPAFARDKIDTKIWIIDHNYDLWGRALDILAKPEVNRYIDGVAWHGYVGDPSSMTRVHDAYPTKHTYWTEGGPDYTAPDYLTDWAKWGGTFAEILRNWARSIIGWNLALDEKGKPNIGPFPCGGMVQIDSVTKAISRSGQYWALAHYSSAIRRGARRIASQGEIEKVSHVAFVNPDGGAAVVLANQGAERDVVIEAHGRAARIHLPPDSLVTLTGRMGA